MVHVGQSDNRAMINCKSIRSALPTANSLQTCGHAKLSQRDPDHPQPEMASACCQSTAFPSPTRLLAARFTPQQDAQEMASACCQSPAFHSPALLRVVHSNPFRADSWFRAIKISLTHPCVSLPASLQSSMLMCFWSQKPTRQPHSLIVASD